MLRSAGPCFGFLSTSFTAEAGLVPKHYFLDQQLSLLPRGTFARVPILFLRPEELSLILPPFANLRFIFSFHFLMGV